MALMRLVLKPGRDKSLRRRHPWLFSGAIARVEGDPQRGDTAEVVSDSGQPLALAAYSPQSQIRARVWSFDTGRRIDAEFLRTRIANALALRAALPAARHSNALRLVHAESDGLPGLVVDRYDNVLVAQFLSAGAERWRDVLVALLADLTGIAAIYERSDVEVRGLEGLTEREGPLKGEGPFTPVVVRENGLEFA